MSQIKVKVVVKLADKLSSKLTMGANVNKQDKLSMLEKAARMALRKGMPERAKEVRLLMLKLIIKE